MTAAIEEEQRGVEQRAEGLDVEREDLEREAGVGEPQRGAVVGCGAPTAWRRAAAASVRMASSTSRGIEARCRCAPKSKQRVEELQDVEAGEGHDQAVGEERGRGGDVPVDGRAAQQRRPPPRAADQRPRSSARDGRARSSRAARARRTRLDGGEMQARAPAEPGSRGGGSGPRRQESSSAPRR